MVSLAKLNSRDNICNALRFIPPHDREIWIRVGMALKSGLGDRGFLLFDDWSKTAHNYNVLAVKSVWKSFKNGAVTISTLFYLAKQNGWGRSGSCKPISPPPKITEAPKPTRQDTHAYGIKLWLAANKEDSFVSKHQYASTKGIDWAAGAGRGIASGSIIGKDNDCLIVPIRNIEFNKVQGVQCINTEGRKQTFGSVSGGALILGNTLDKSLIWYVCEGWASAVSMVFHHQKGNGVCAASFGKDRQEKVAASIERTYQPDIIEIVLEDDL